MVSIIPKKTKKAPEWYNFGFYIAVAFLIAVVLGYAGLFYFEGKAWDTLQDLEDRIGQVGVKEEKLTEAKVLIAKRKINDFSKLLEVHKKSSNLFAFLESVSHPKVWFTEVRLSPESAKAIIAGRPVNFQTLDQQLFILGQQDLIERVELTNLSIGKSGETKFSLNISLNPQIFK